MLPGTLLVAAAMPAAVLSLPEWFQRAPALEPGLPQPLADPRVAYQVTLLDAFACSNFPEANVLCYGVGIMHLQLQLCEAEEQRMVEGCMSALLRSVHMTETI